MKHPKNHIRSTSNQQGFTLVEMLLGMAISAFLIAGIIAFQQLLLQGEEFGISTAFTIENAQSSLQTAVGELRNARSSEQGAYPVELADDQELIFYSNTDNDDEIERVRYFLDGTELKKGVIQPEGFPVTYPSGGEVVVTVAQYIQNGSDPIFYYYNGDWPGDQINNPLPTPANRSEVKLVKIEVRVNADPSNPQSELVLEPFVQIRMLKENL